ncbi:MAG: hypothetical protein L6R35_007170 [Caloplaca aegaea]|nr:MAG: hypothetical protein L6R35_007170 [Caloplaca aegaea]
MVTPGGETAFASRLMAESAALGTRVQWYTTLLGKYSSVAVVVEELRGKYGVGNWAVKEFVQGEKSKTRRWGVGWSWGARRPAEEVARAVRAAGVPRALLPFPARFAFEVAGVGVGVQGVADKVNGILEGMDLEWRYRPQVSAGVGFARENVWSRAARRQRLKYKDGGGGGDGNEKMDEEEEEEEPALGFKVQLLMLKEGKGTEVVVRWLVGRESVLFESFCGMLKRQVVGG